MDCNSFPKNFLMLFWIDGLPWRNPSKKTEPALELGEMHQIQHQHLTKQPGSVQSQDCSIGAKQDHCGTALWPHREHRGRRVTLHVRGSESRALQESLRFASTTLSLQTNAMSSALPHPCTPRLEALQSEREFAGRSKRDASACTCMHTHHVKA